MIVSLSQAELDDVYHPAYFQCEAAAVNVVRRVLGRFDEDKANRDLLINCICEALHEVEVKHMGTVRYVALMERLTERGKEPRA
ncbi:MAG: hypothetical protein ACTHKQ_01065 [Mesorhizobium sp.]